MMQQSSGAVESLKPFALAAYLVAILLILAPPLDIFFSMPVTQPSDARWRFGAVGLVTGAMLLPLAGMLLAVMTAVLCRHTVMFRVILALGALIAAGLTGALGMFVLDTLQVRPGVAQPMVQRFDLAVLKSALTQLTQIVALLAILWTGIRANRLRDRLTAMASRSEGSAVVVGAGR